MLLAFVAEWFCAFASRLLLLNGTRGFLGRGLKESVLVAVAVGLSIKA